MTATELIHDADALERWTAAWDELAVSQRKPFCAPVWMLSWWGRAAPPGAQLQTVVVSDADALVGIAPFYSRRVRGITRYRLLGAGATLLMHPLAMPGREEEVAASITRALAGARPRPDVITFEGVEATCPWPQLLAAAWPGKSAWRHLDTSMPAPQLDIAGLDFESWLSSKSTNFRQQTRRDRRKLEKAGATQRLVDASNEVQAALAEFSRLHHARWSERGGSGVLNPEVEEMLRQVGREWSEQGRFRVYVAEAEGSVVAAQIFVAAGGDVYYWLGGFDESWAALKPSIQGILFGIEDAMKRGDRLVDLGGGGQEYKYRLADREVMLEWISLVPPGHRYPWVRLRLAPAHAWRALLDRTSTETKEKVKGVLKRLGLRSGP